MADPLRPSGPQIPGSLMGEIQSEVAVEATPLLSFVLRNSRIIVTCIVLLVLVIAGVGGWQWHQTRPASSFKSPPPPLALNSTERPPTRMPPSPPPIPRAPSV